MAEIQGDLNTRPQKVSSFTSVEEAKIKTPSRKHGCFKKHLAQKALTVAAASSMLFSSNSSGLLNSQPSENIPFPGLGQRMTIEKGQDYSIVDERLTLDELKRRTEDLFQIEIASSAEPETFSRVGKKDMTVVPIDWTREEMSNLVKTLENLPPHFYASRLENIRHDFTTSYARAYAPGQKPSEEETQKWQEDKYMNELKQQFGDDLSISEKDLHRAIAQGYYERMVEGVHIRFVIANLMPSDIYGENAFIAQCFHCGELASIKNNRNQPQVFFRSGELSTKDKDVLEVAFSNVTHELAHLVTTHEDQNFVETLLEVPYDKGFRDFMLDNIISKKDYWDALDSDEYIKFFASYGHDGGSINWRLQYGNTSPDEFISVASEFYVQGKEYFAKIYGVFIGKEKANTLYDYMRDKIFRGQEYERYEKIESSVK